MTSSIMKTTTSLLISYFAGRSCSCKCSGSPKLTLLLLLLWPCFGAELGGRDFRLGKNHERAALY